MSEQTTVTLPLNSLQAKQIHFVSCSNDVDLNQNHLMASFGSVLPKNNPTDTLNINADQSWKSAQTLLATHSYTPQSPAFNTNSNGEYSNVNQFSDLKFEGKVNTQEYQYSSKQQFTQNASGFQNDFKIPSPLSKTNNKSSYEERFEGKSIQNVNTQELNQHSEQESISFKPLNQQYLQNWSATNGGPYFQQTTLQNNESEGKSDFKLPNYALGNQQKKLNSDIPSNAAGTEGKFERNDAIRINNSGKQIIVPSQAGNEENPQSMIAKLIQELDLKDKAILNTYNISFLANKDQPIDLIEMMEKYVLVCAENEKLSYGFIEKLTQIEQLNQKIKESTTQKENWKTLYENKVQEVSALSKEYGILNEMLKDIKSSSQEMEKTLNQQVQSSKQNSEKQEQVLREENQNLRSKLSELLRVTEEQGGNKKEQPNGLQEKLIKMLDENEELNRLLSERVDEVAYLQETIKQMQDTQSSQQSTDSRFQKVVQDLEAEIKRMDENMEQIIQEKDHDQRVKGQIVEENNELRVQLQQKRKELEEFQISSNMSQISQVNARKKQEQIEELLLKMERMERSKNDIFQQSERFKAESFQVKEQLKKLEKRYEDKSKESIEHLVKTTELTAQIKQLKAQNDTSFIEKDLHQASFEKKQLLIQINECQYELERAKAQLEAARKEIESLTKQQLMQKQKSVDREMSLQDEIQRLKYDQTKEQESYKYKAKIEIQEQFIINLQSKQDQAEKVIKEYNVELEEKQQLIKELRAKLDRISNIEGALHAADKENTDLQQFKEEASALIEELKCRTVKMSIENERLHKIIEELKKCLETEREQADKQSKFNEEYIEKIEEEIVTERAGFQEVIRKLEEQIAKGDNQGRQEIFISDQSRYKELQEEFIALKREFELAINTLKQRDQQIMHIEGKYNQLVAGDRNSHVITKLEEKLQILSAENLRLNKILVDRVRFSQNNW